MSVRVNKDSGEVYLYGVVGDGLLDDGFTSIDVIEALNSIGNKRATVRINSPGGIAFEGIAIYNAIKRHKAGADTVVDALAASAASIIALAGENRTTAENASWMVHRAMTFAMGNATNLAKTIQKLEDMDRQLVDIYSKAMNKTPDEIMAMMEAETWINAKQSLEFGLSTKMDITNLTEPIIGDWFEKKPEAITGRLVRLADIKNKCLDAKTKTIQTGAKQWRTMKQ